MFNDIKPSGSFKLANIIVKSKTYSKKFMISLGETGMKIPKSPKIGEKYKTPQLSYTYNFDHGETISTFKPYKGAGCIKLTGDGKYKFQTIKMPWDFLWDSMV